MKQAQGMGRLPWASLMAALALQANAEAISYDALAPLLGERCVMCHSGPSAAAGLRLDGPPYLGAEDIGLIETWIVQGARDAAGKPARIPIGARLRLHGMLDGLDPGSLAGARRDKLPRPGDYVRLDGRLDDEGKVVTGRLRRR